MLIANCGFIYRPRITLLWCCHWAGTASLPDFLLWRCGTPCATLQHCLQCVDDCPYLPNHTSNVALIQRQTHKYNADVHKTIRISPSSSSTTSPTLPRAPAMSRGTCPRASSFRPTFLRTDAVSWLCCVSRRRNRLLHLPRSRNPARRGHAELVACELKL